MTPTSEQVAAINAFATGGSVVVQALAGTGKTQTLLLMAESTRRRGQYLAFSRALVTEAGEKFSDTSTACRTVHSLAYGAVGYQYRGRLNGPRMRSQEIARVLGVEPIELPTGVGNERRRLAPGFLGSLAMQAVGRFCQSADEVPSGEHVPYVDGLDLPQPDGRKGWTNNRELRRYLAPFVTRAWLDLCQTRGRLRYDHCQPPGTMVRRLTCRMPAVWEEVPIEQIREGDYVVSWNGRARRGTMRRTGQPVTSVGQRDFAGDLVTIETNHGRRSSYTPDHLCIARLDGDLRDGNHVVYLARRGNDYRIGRTTWRTSSQANALGIRRRADSQGATATWILSVHPTDREAALAEALTSHQFHLPTWQFRSKNAVMPCAEFWAKAGNNREQAAACLHAFNRDIRFPLLETKETRTRAPGDNGTWSSLHPWILRACNLLPGMRVCEPDEVLPQQLGEQRTYNASGAWSDIATITITPYVGPVFSLDVAEDHTYVADGIVTHNCHYLKLWQLSDPVINADFVLWDECQDSSKVMESIVRQQTNMQVIAVGDANQAIFEWLGAIDALTRFEEHAEKVCTLSQSFRFGPAVADVANVILGQLDTPLRVKGLPAIDSEVVIENGPNPTVPDAVLCRTNATSVRRVLEYRQAGRKVALVGDGKEVLSFARGAQKLQQTGSTDHPELACFMDWPSVRAYVSADPQGHELRLMVDLVDEFGTPIIEDALSGVCREENADVVVSTAHKAKGRQWGRVRLAEDFPVGTPEKPLEASELRLAYVAVTRAQHVLDLSACPTLAQEVESA